MAWQDPNLREIFLRRTEAAFARGGWVAANKALRISLATEVEVYADDEHINAVTRAELALLRDLENKPLACRAFLFAGGMADELLQAKPDDQLLWFAHKAALQNGFERRLSGIGWTRPNEKETTDVMWFLGRGPIAALTPAELTATANYLDGDPDLACSAAITAGSPPLSANSVEPPKRKMRCRKRSRFRPHRSSFRSISGRPGSGQKSTPTCSTASEKPVGRVDGAIE